MWLFNIANIIFISYADLCEQVLRMKTHGFFLFLVACFCFILVSPVHCSYQESSPILIIPGFMGSQLMVKDDLRPCCTSQKFTDIWLSVRLVLAPECSASELKLEYDPLTDSYNDSKGVTIRAKGFGETNAVEGFYNLFGNNYLIPYLKPLVDYFVKRGYIRGKSIRAAPYDWRLAADELEKRDYYANLKTLVEDMYNKNGKKKVTIVVHSMGGLVSHYFLTSFSGINQAWKDTYINAWVTLSGVWSGAVVALEAVITGRSKISEVNEFIASVTRTFESAPWLFPRRCTFSDTVLISTPSRNYTADDYKELFTSVGYTNGFKTFQRVLAINKGFPAPNVPTYCYYGSSVDTMETIIFKKNLNSKKSVGKMHADIAYGDGDGTVNIQSAQLCRAWQLSMPAKYPFHYHEYKNMKHFKAPADNRVLADIALIVKAPPPQ